MSDQWRTDRLFQGNKQFGRIRSRRQFWEKNDSNYKCVCNDEKFSPLNVFLDEIIFKWLVALKSRNYVLLGQSFSVIINISTLTWFHLIYRTIRHCCQSSKLKNTTKLTYIYIQPKARKWLLYINFSNGKTFFMENLYQMHPRKEKLEKFITHTGQQQHHTHYSPISEILGCGVCADHTSTFVE